MVEIPFGPTFWIVIVAQKLTRLHWKDLWIRGGTTFRFTMRSHVWLIHHSPSSITLSFYLYHVSSWCLKLVIIGTGTSYFPSSAPFACRTGSGSYSEENEFMNHHNVTSHNCSHPRSAIGHACSCCYRYQYPKRIIVNCK